MPETPKRLAETKKWCGYVEPPQELIDATVGKSLGEREWFDVQYWLDRNTTNGTIAMLVYLAERYDATISDAYSAHAAGRLPTASPPEDAPPTLDEYKERCGYVDPPQDLADATTGKFLGEDQEWSRLHQWFRENTPHADDAMHCFIAEKYGQTFGQVYVAADSYFKRCGVGDDEYVNYN